MLPQNSSHQDRHYGLLSRQRLREQVDSELDQEQATTGTWNPWEDSVWDIQSPDFDAAASVREDLKLLARERNLARSERETSSAEMATLADRMNNMHTELQAARDKTINQVETKEKSARSSQLLLQTKLADLELQMASMEQNLQEKAIILQTLQKDIDRSFANQTILKDRIHKDEGAIRKAAYEAAEYSVKALNDKRIGNEI